MSSLTDKLIQKGLIEPPSFFKNNIHYEAVVGSHAYGVATKDSDIDIYGFVIPPKHIIFPYNYGHIYEFGRKPETFGQFQDAHIQDVDSNTEYDITIYNIVKYFHLVMEGNPNMIDSLYVPESCVLFCSRIGKLVRDNRKIFLSKKLYHRFAGYAYSQLHKMKSKTIKQWVELCEKCDVDPYTAIPASFPKHYKKEATRLYKSVYSSGKLTKRLDLVVKFGWDVQFGYHTVRLLLETEQLLSEQTLHLDAHKDVLTAIRNGEWAEEDITALFDKHIDSLKELYEKSTLPYSPDEEAVKTLLIQCLEEHYGSLDEYIAYDKQVVTYLYKARDFLTTAIKKFDKGDNSNV